MSEPAKISRATAAAKRSTPAKGSTTAKDSTTAKRPGPATKRASARSAPVVVAASSRERPEALPCGVPIPKGVGPDDPIPRGLTHDEEMAFRIARMRAITERAIRTKKASIELLHRAGLMTKKGEWKKIYR